MCNCSTNGPESANQTQIVDDFIALASKEFALDILNRHMEQAEEKLMRSLMSLALSIIRTGLEKADVALHENKPEDLKVKSIQKRSLETLMGKVIFRRRRYESQEHEGYIYLLDQSMGLPQNSCVSAALTKKITTLALKTSYRNASDEHGYLTGSFLSAPTIKACISKSAKKIQSNIDQRKTEIDKNFEIKPTKQVKQLLVEADGVYIHLQRPKNCDKSKTKRIGKNMNIVKFYENKEECLDKAGKPQYKTQHTAVYIDMSDTPQEFYDNCYAAKISQYDIYKIEKSYLATDGEIKYKNLKEILPNTAKCQTVHILDKWHVIDRLNKLGQEYPKLKKYVKKYIYQENDTEKAIRLILGVKDSQENTRTDEKWTKELEALAGYLANNKNSINSEYPVLGTMESTNAHIIGSRLKNYGGAWSIKGANDMGLCLAAFFNHQELPPLTDEKILERKFIDKTPPKEIKTKYIHLKTPIKTQI
jgi:hypothetical protein